MSLMNEGGVGKQEKKHKPKGQHISIFHLATMTRIAYLNESKTYYKTSEKLYSLK